jgi:hypothetical protein
VDDRFVVMRVAVADPSANLRFVRVPMVCVVLVFVLVIHGLVRVNVSMTLGKMQPHACGHDDHCCAQPPCDRLVKDEHR